MLVTISRSQSRVITSEKNEPRIKPEVLVTQYVTPLVHSAAQNTSASRNGRVEGVQEHMVPIEVLDSSQPAEITSRPLQNTKKLGSCAVWCEAFSEPAVGFCFQVFSGVDAFVPAWKHVYLTHSLFSCELIIAPATTQNWGLCVSTETVFTERRQKPCKRCEVPPPDPLKKRLFVNKLEADVSTSRDKTHAGA